MTAEKPRKSSKKVQYFESTGRRKSATCRTRLYLVNITARGIAIKKGEMVVNGKSISEYFPGELMKKQYEKPFAITKSLDRFSVSAVVNGGGKSAQLEAFVLSVARTLQKVDTSLHTLLKQEGMLRVDSRARERRKAGLAQKARKEKQSPKR
jgi:small subunit ribosomal protein S9